MIAILVIAAGVSAITAMRLAIAGTEVTVPPLEGKTEEEAAEILSANKLFLRVSSSKRFSQGVPADRVMEQDPPAGTRLKSGRSVKVLLSAGESRYAVPNLVGSSLRAAQLTLAQRNFVLGNATMTHTATGEPQTIQQQDPQPGSKEGADPAVNVLVSLGPAQQAFVMPDVVGKRLDQIGPRIRAEGFTLEKVRYRKASGLGPGIIVQQQPQSGHRLLKTDNIVLEVSQ
jgi:serine/threonine-protein kinase